MLQKHRDLLQSKESELTGMDTDKVLAQLTRAGKFSHTDCEIVNAEPTTVEKNPKIIELISGRGSDAFDVFFTSLCSIDGDHARMAEILQPVRHRILWFTSSPRHAAAVAYGLETYYDSVLTATERRNSKKNYILRRGRCFKREVDSRSDYNHVLFARDVEVYLAFPTSEKGDTPRKALLEVFEDHGREMQAAVLSGACLGVRRNSGEQMGVRGGEVVMATEAVAVGCDTKELPISSALANAKTRLSHLTEKQPKWLEEAKSRLQSDHLPMPHYDAIRHNAQDTPSSSHGVHIPRALATDSDTYPFYDQCKRKLGVERPWFSCKGVMSYEMLNNADTNREVETDCVVASTLFALEACDAIVEKLRRLAT